LKKRHLIAAALAGAAFCTNASARVLDPSKPEDALEISKRMQCGEKDNVPAVYHWSGKVYSRVAGEPDRHLFDGEGMNIRRCVSTNDPKRGRGWRMVSREVMLYLDPATGQVLREWKNPWSDETVKVMHIANDPVNGRGYTFPYDAQGKPYTIDLRPPGQVGLLSRGHPALLPQCAGGRLPGLCRRQVSRDGDFRLRGGGDELLDTKYATAYPTVSWVRISDWMPWMKMRGRQGQIVFNAMGAKVRSFNELPTC
jgi:hypothetical protein